MLQGGGAYAMLRRRSHARIPAPANIRPGKPAPTIGPGTGEVDHVPGLSLTTSALVRVCRYTSFVSKVGSLLLVASVTSDVEDRRSKNQSVTLPFNIVT